MPLTAFSANGDWMPTAGAVWPPNVDPVEWIVSRLAEPQMASVVARHDPERRSEELAKQIEELTIALRHWESQASILLEKADASARIRYMASRVSYSAGRRLERVVRWLLRSDSRTG